MTDSEPPRGASLTSQLTQQPAFGPSSLSLRGSVTGTQASVELTPPLHLQVRLQITQEVEEYKVGCQPPLVPSNTFPSGTAMQWQHTPWMDLSVPAGP